MKTKEKRNTLRLALSLAAVLALLVGIGIQAGLAFWRYQQSRVVAGEALGALSRICSEELREKRQERLEALGGSGEEARERLMSLAAEKGTTQRDKHLELLMLVNPWHPLPEGYVPELAPAVSAYQPNSGFEMDARCTDQLRQMLDDCRMLGLQPYICSAYRTQDYQQMLFDNKIGRLVEEGVSPEDAPEEAATTVALPGTSEHQLGLAVDLMDESYPYLNEAQEWTETQRWLMDNCWRYGFILRYPNGTSDITGIIYEPWHYRYVGKEYAKILYDLDITLEEYLQLRNGR